MIFFLFNCRSFFEVCYLYMVDSRAFVRTHNTANIGSKIRRLVLINVKNAAVISLS